MRMTRSYELTRSILLMPTRKTTSQGAPAGIRMVSPCPVKSYNKDMKRHCIMCRAWRYCLACLRLLGVISGRFQRQTAELFRVVSLKQRQDGNISISILPMTCSRLTVYLEYFLSIIHYRALHGITAEQGPWKGASRH